MSTSNNNPQPGDVDARLQFLLTSTESLHATSQELHATVDALGIRVANLVAVSERHERDNARFNRVLGAALKAFLEGEGNQQ